MKRFAKGSGGKRFYRKSSGVTSVRHGYGEDWRKLSEEVKIRDGYRCQKCGIHKLKLSLGGFLSVHHIRPISKGGATVKSNLITICDGLPTTCHGKQPGHKHLQGPPADNITKRPEYTPPKRGRGRPPGSGKKATTGQSKSTKAFHAATRKPKFKRFK